MFLNRDVLEKIRQIRPRSVVYLFSAGKDSSLVLLLSRDFVKELCNEIKCKALIVYIYVTGNTHPLNNACAHYIMQWHKKYYGFEPVYLASSKNFLECAAKYGFEILRGGGAGLSSRRSLCVSSRLGYPSRCCT
jgi:hypothetical protein